MKRSNCSLGLTAMAIFLFFGATVATLAGITLLFPGSFLDPMWRFNPEAGEQLRHLGRWDRNRIPRPRRSDDRCRDWMD